MSRRRQHRRPYAASGGTLSPAPGGSEGWSERKAGPLGPGAGVLMTEYPLSMALGGFLGKDTAKRQLSAVKLAREVSYIRRAESTISDKVGGMQPGIEPGWHIEDPDGETVDETYPDARAVTAYDLIRDPQGLLDPEERQSLSRRSFWQITSRHMGLAGCGFWYADGQNTYGMPLALLYVAPWRVRPRYRDRVVLTGWTLDPDASGNGTDLPLEAVSQLRLEAPDEGVWPAGLVESVIAKANLNMAIDRHETTVLASGGRLSGILSPKEGAITDDGVFNQMVRDWRNVTETPESARRLQIVRAPVEFTTTVMSPGDLQLVELMERNRDDLLAAWGVPLSQIGGMQPGGLNSGETRSYDEAVLWQGPVHARLVEIAEAIQGILDAWRPLLGWSPRFVLDEPTFDDATPRYERASKAVSLPLRNSERRAILGLDPFGDPALDDAVWMPVTVQPVTWAPAEPMAPMAAGPERQPVLSETPRQLADAQKASMKAGRIETGARALRTAMEARWTPRLRRDVGTVLADQRERIAGLVRRNWESIVAAPLDESQWWDPRNWDRKLADALRPGLAVMADTVSDRVRSVLAPAKASPLVEDAVSYVLRRGVLRVQGINDTTRKGIAKLIAEGIEAGASPADVGDAIERWTGFDEYRAERIATTELAAAYNDSALHEYAAADISQVEAIDGDDDPECAARNGQVFSIADAASIIDHPNGTLDWVPIVA